MTPTNTLAPTDYPIGGSRPVQAVRSWVQPAGMTVGMVERAPRTRLTPDEARALLAHLPYALGGEAYTRGRAVLEEIARINP